MCCEGLRKSGALSLLLTVISGLCNSASSGGAIFDFAGTSLALTRTTVSGNSALGGGAIYTDFGRVVLTNSTIAGKSSTDAGRFGAAIFNGNNSRIRLINSTVAGNGNSAFSSEVTLQGTLVANNGLNCQGNGQHSLGYNVSDDDSCSSFMTETGGENNVAPGAGLDPKGLQDNGGPTQTIALLPDSPAVDRIPTRACMKLEFRSLLVDQRGIPRPQGPACDTGAFELAQGVLFSSFRPTSLDIVFGKASGFALDATFTPGGNSGAIDPPSEAVTLGIGSYMVTIPSGSFRPGPGASYVYLGNIGFTERSVTITPAGGSTYRLFAFGTTVYRVDAQSPALVTLSIGNNNGSAWKVPVILRE